MASSYSPQEIADIEARHAQAVLSGSEDLAALDKELRDARVGIKNYSKELENARKDLKASVGGLVGGMMSGKKGLSQYNDTIGAATDGLSVLAKAVPLIGTALGMAIKAVGAYTKKVTEQADVLSSTYKEISQIGVTGSAGMQGVFDSAQKFGYTITEMGEFGGLMADNSTALAQLGGTALSGSETFADMSKSITRSDFGGRMQSMGMTVDTMNKGVAAYLKLQVQQGRAREMTQEQLTAGAAEYIEQQDKLAKITGLNAKEQLSIRESARAEEKFGAKLRTLEASGSEEEAKKAKMYEELNVTMAKTAPGFAQGMRDIVAGGGAITSKEANQLNTVAPKTVAMIKEGKASAAEIRQHLAQELKSKQKFFDEQAQRGVGADAFGNANEVAALIQQGETMEDSDKTAKKQQDVTDGLTKSTVKLENAQRNITQKLDTGFNKGLSAVTKSLETIVGGANTAATGVGSAVGVAPAGGGQIGSGKNPNEGNTPGGEKGKTSGFSQQDLSAMGLKMKQGDVQAPGAPLNEKTINLAKNIQSKVPGFSYFSGFNDSYHLKKSPNSQHAKGLGIDFALSKPPSKNEGQELVSMLKSMGATHAIDEYNNPSAKATAGHMHAQISAANGGIASGPKSGYAATLHGTEAIVPLPNGNSIPVEMPGGMGGEEQNEILELQISKMGDLMKVMENQLAISNKILQMSQ